MSINKMMVAAFALAASVGLAETAIAQMSPNPSAQPARVRGIITAIDGPLLVVKGRDGTDYKIVTPDNLVVSAMVPIKLSDVKVGSYIGVAAMPQSDGSQKAISVSIFPEAARGVAEGFRPWDVRPNSTMTNATVADSVAGTDGQTLLVKYKDGEKKVLITPETSIVTTVAGDKSELKAGAAVIIMSATRKPDGTLEAARITVGRGVTPPM